MSEVKERGHEAGLAGGVCGISFWNSEALWNFITSKNQVELASVFKTLSPGYRSLDNTYTAKRMFLITLIVQDELHNFIFNQM